MRADLAPPESRAPERGLRGRLVTGRPGQKVIADGTVVFAGERILWCGPTAELPAGVGVETEKVPVILPGLVDVHCHGGVGHTFGADGDGARRAAAFHAAQGTTSVLASLVSAPSSVLLEQIAALRELVQDGTLAGLHLEGPFITKSMCGAQDPDAIIDGDPVLLRQWLETGQGAVRSLTLAPETAHFAELVDLCRIYGVVPSLGHTGATASLTRQALAGVPAGAGGGFGGGFAGGGPWSATHLFNRMPPLGHRTPGPIPVLLQAAQQSPEQMVLELVADGVHLDPEIVRMVFGLVGPGAVALVTDAMAAAGMSDGHYTLGRLDVLVEDGVARLVPGEAGSVPGEEELPAEDRGHRGAIAGATSVLLENVRRCVEWGVPLADAVTAASATPARLMALDKPNPAQQGANQVGARQVGAGRTPVGSITAGYRADVLVATDDLELVRAYKAGRALTQERNTRADYSV